MDGSADIPASASLLLLTSYVPQKHLAGSSSVDINVEELRLSLRASNHKLNLSVSPFSAVESLVRSSILSVLLN